MEVQNVVPFGKIWVWALGPVNNLCSSCAQLTKSVRVSEGRMEPPSVFALFGVGITGYGPPQAQGDLAKPVSL